ncbi:integrase arm-type DNA-binding domain-containing protein [Haemophilus parahaemolyticus]|uniref:integrase arm-type DNA-binding domain-containing protein n=1 Tax=Haemophilus parahaemolyticus TaxID=735 RepID=UPI0021151196|nr:integrase arm-type DNA-binding domain-containing protein [Haemophilus parahaemolyticus]
MTKPLTNTEIEKAKPRDKDYTLSDGQGLYLLIKFNGSKLWRFNYYQPFTNPKKRVLLGVGKYPDIFLAQARERRAEDLALLVQNVDPQSHRKQVELNNQLTKVQIFYDQIQFSFQTTSHRILSSKW